jgi:hypothetical protein
VLTFGGDSVAGNSISDGVYDITLDHTQVQPVTGSGTLAASRTDTFYRHVGGDSSFLAAMDFSADGSISTAVARQFSRRFGITYSGFTPTI